MTDYVPTVDSDGELFTDVPTFACRLCGCNDGDMNSDSMCQLCLEYAVPPTSSYVDAWDTNPFDIDEREELDPYAA